MRSPGTACPSREPPCPLVAVLMQHALGQTIQTTCPDYNGPRLGIKQTDANKREWTPEQLEEQVRPCHARVREGQAASVAWPRRSLRSLLAGDTCRVEGSAHVLCAARAL